MDISTADEYFELVLPQMVEAKPELLEGVSVVAQWNVEGEAPSVWTTIVEDGKLTCTKGAADNPEIVVDIGDEVLLDIYRDNLKPVTAYMKKQLKIAGDLEKALKLARLLQEESI